MDRVPPGGSNGVRWWQLAVANVPANSHIEEENTIPHVPVARWDVLNCTALARMPAYIVKAVQTRNVAMEMLPCVFE
jgi:hypothetical protein